VSDLEEDSAGDGEDDDAPVPMGTSGSISEIREKLHAKIASFKKGRNAEDEAGSKDELLEMRRQRAVMRERRRKETKEKKKKEKEEKKERKEKTASGNTSKVRKTLSSISSELIPNLLCSHSYWYKIPYHPQICIRMVPRLLPRPLLLSPRLPTLQ
jgi:hypothetical protein